MEFDPFGHLSKSSAEIAQALLELFPILLIPFIFSGLCYKFVSFSEESERTAVFEIFFFCLLGVACAYIGYFARESFVSSVLPGVVAGAVVIFQLLGLSLEKVAVPFSTRKVLLSASGGCMCFMISSRYLQLAYGIHASSP